MPIKFNHYKIILKKNKEKEIDAYIESYRNVEEELKNKAILSFFDENNKLAIVYMKDIYSINSEEEHDYFTACSSCGKGFIKYGPYYGKCIVCEHMDQW